MMRFLLFCFFIACCVSVGAMAKDRSFSNTESNVTSSATANVEASGTNSSSNVEWHDDDDLSPMCAAMIFAALVVLGAVLVVAILVGLLAAVVVFALIIAGVVSSTVIVGLARRSLSTAFKFLLYQICAIGGGAVGAILVLLLRWVLHKPWRTLPTLISGGIGGIVAGVAIAALTILAIQKTYRFFSTK
jgi:hypothetical protein